MCLPILITYLMHPERKNHRTSPFISVIGSVFSWKLVTMPDVHTMFTVRRFIVTPRKQPTCKQSHMRAGLTTPFSKWTSVIWFPQDLIVSGWRLFLTASSQFVVKQSAYNNNNNVAMLSISKNKQKTYLFCNILWHFLDLTIMFLPSLQWSLQQT